MRLLFESTRDAGLWPRPRRPSAMSFRHFSPFSRGGRESTASGSALALLAAKKGASPEDAAALQHFALDMQAGARPDPGTSTMDSGGGA